MKESIGLGILTGAGSGFVVGSLAVRNGSSGKVTGALVGAALGGIAGYFIHSGMDGRDAKVRKETLFNLDKFNVSHPSANEDNDYGVAAPSVETECFDTEVRGDKLVQAHCESHILGSPEWVKNSNQKKKAKSE